MKKLIVLAVVVMAFSMVSAAYAQAPQWLVSFKATDAVNGNAAATTTFGTKNLAKDATEVTADSNDTNMVAGVSTSVYFASFDNAIDPDGSAGNGWSTDRRAPYDGYKWTWKTWNAKLWMNSAASHATIKLTGWNATGTTSDLPANWTAKVTVVNDPQGLYTGQTFTFNTAANGTSSTPQLNWSFSTGGGEFYKGLNNAMTLKFEAVPEPGSMVAMLSGLVGLGGYVIRRKK
jgi:hypothetical protein